MRRAYRSSDTCIFCQLLPVSRSRTRQPPQRTRPASRKYTRPSFAPRPVIDIKHIAQNPGLYEQNCIDRNYAPQAQNSWQLLDLRTRRAQLQQKARETREANNRLQEQLKRTQQLLKKGTEQGGAAESSGESSLQQLLEQAKQFKDELSNVADEEKRIDEDMLELALALPNLSGPHTPSGSKPEVLRVHQAGNSAQESGNAIKSHTDIGTSLDILDFSAASASSGWGWYFLKNEAALLEQALIQYTISVLRNHGYSIVSPPSIVYSHIAAACGFQPRDQNDEQQTYQLMQPEKDRERKPALSLAATAEIPLAAMKSGTTLSEDELPLKVAAVSRCYRAEAGARGVDTKGLYRVHEFTKVEMFAWTMPDAISVDDTTIGYFDSGEHPSQADGAFNEMISIQEEILQSLGLSYRVLEMPSEELGATGSRKQDIEVYFPSRKDKDDGWGEVTSTSICTDYQTRRLATRLRRKAGEMDWPYTLNGTALAVPRIIAALLETGYTASPAGVSGKGTVTIPKCLAPWMGGKETIG